MSTPVWFDERDLALIGVFVVFVNVVGTAFAEEEWGKSLALYGPGAESGCEVERSGKEAKAMSYQERFVQLQVFLKKCDEDDQSYLLDGEIEDVNDASDFEGAGVLVLCFGVRLAVSVGGE